MTSVTAHHMRPAAVALLLPHGPAGVSPARRRLSTELAALGVAEEAVDDAALVLSELLSNAFRHGRPLADHPNGRGGRNGGTIRVAWRLDAEGLLTLEVTDGGGPTRPRAPRPSLMAHGGRGLGIVDVLARAWGFRDGGAPGEVTVWAEVPLRAKDPVGPEPW